MRIIAQRMATDPERPHHFPPAVVEVAAERTGYVAVGAAILLPVVQLLHAATRPSAGVIFNDLNRLVLVGIVLASIGLFAVRHFRTAPASTVLRLGMALQVGNQRDPVQLALGRNTEAV